MAKQLDRICIRDLRLRCIIGINDDERIHKQDVIVNVVLHADLSTARKSDRIEDTVDYKTLKKSLVSLVEGSNYFLVERLADAIAEQCLSHALVQRADVTLDKPGALRFAESVAVEVSLER